MFQALLCPSSGAHDYSADYHMVRMVSWVAVGWKLGTEAGWISIRAAGYSTIAIACHLSSLPAPNLQPTADQE